MQHDHSLLPIQITQLCQKLLSKAILRTLANAPLTTNGATVEAALDVCIEIEYRNEERDNRGTVLVTGKSTKTCTTFKNMQASLKFQEAKQLSTKYLRYQRYCSV